MMKKETVNREATINSIINRCNSSIGYSINIKKFKEDATTDKYIIEAAKFVGAEIIYN